jgi:hypothetical protein
MFCTMPDRLMDCGLQIAHGSGGRDSTGHDRSPTYSCHDATGSIGKLLAAESSRGHYTRAHTFEGSIGSTARLPIVLVILSRRRIRGRAHRGRLLRRGIARWPCERKKVSGAFDVATGNDATVASSVPRQCTHRSRRRDHSPVLLRTGVPIPAPSSRRSGAGQAGVRFAGLVNFPM